MEFGESTRKRIGSDAENERQSHSLNQLDETSEALFK